MLRSVIYSALFLIGVPQIAGAAEELKCGNDDNFNSATLRSTPTTQWSIS